ncbi:hypothetical protein HYN59_03485 [Flavobacterium album]|uniref:WGR domain-containing protein n=1 Tax=Flavobacterium album TaxID=2175091 RepID=A0A2S1QUY2_9FLAO|nr:DUF6493 family protein [Flavobacterium album]AWH84230.1 hypothetical protein HYN59_03485 [Flavobacterium album]
MIKHLQYTDDTSDKFWQIEVTGNSHTVTFGRSGTSGQAKTKDFDTDEACLADAEKLIKEKIKKGYSENGTAGEIAVAKPTSGAKVSAKEIKENLARELKALIDETNYEGIIPFLEKYAKEHKDLLKKEIKTYSGWLGSDKNEIASCVAFAVFDFSDTRNWDKLADALRSYHKIDKIKKALDWAKPSWIGEYLLQFFRQWQRNGRSIYFHYNNLRKLEEWGHVKHDPELFALYLSIYSDGLDYICNDELAYKRDLPLLFEYETSLHTTWIYKGSKAAASWPEDLTVFWDVAFWRLLEEGKIEKEFLLTHVIEVQTKNWHNHLKAYLRKVLLRAGLERELVIKHQALFLPLLHSEQSSIVNFAIDSLKPYFAEKDFDLVEFLNWAEPVFMRAEMKGGVKALLIQLDIAIAKKPELKDRICSLVTDMFMIPGLQLQERAAAFLLKHGKDAEVGEKLAMYASQMLGKVANDLKPLMSPDASGETSAVTADADEDYIFDPIAVKRLDDKIAYPETWNDILFHIGKTVKSDDTVDLEIMLQSWVCKRDLFPPDYKEQLEPYIKQLDKYRQESWHRNFSREFIPFLENEDRVYRYERYNDSATYNIHTLSDLVILAQQRICDKVSLPFLSAPTHTPLWVDPAVLAERIVAYEKANQKINLTDLAVAISRMPRENTEEATKKLPEIQDADVRALLDFALGNTTAIPEVKDREWAGLWALAARTYQPDAVFSEFSKSFGDVPFMVEPYRPGLQTKAKYWGAYSVALGDWEKTKYVADVLDIPFPKRPDVPYTFFYGKDVYTREEKKAWYFDGSDVTFMYSIMPQNTEALALFLASIFNKEEEFDYRQTPILLRHMLNSFYRLDPGSVIYLATSVFNKNKNARAMAGEVLVRSIEENRLPLKDMGSKLGILVNRQYAPANRMLGLLEPLRDISHKHNDALFKLLEYILPEIKLSDNMPGNVKKILELYYDMKHKLGRQVSPSVEIALNELEGLKLLQPIINKIKK